jgi:hypothetical protein
MSEPEPDAPTLDLPLQAAIEEMTGFEALGIEKRYGRKLEELGGMALTIGVVWVYENRREKTSWVTVEQRTLRQLNGYFAQPPDDINEDEPDSPLGKGF